MQERYAYYPGCLASLSQKELDELLARLGGARGGAAES